jgi:hypothetical protein
VIEFKYGPDQWLFYLHEGSQRSRTSGIGGGAIAREAEAYRKDIERAVRAATRLAVVTLATGRAFHLCRRTSGGATKAGSAGLYCSVDSP